MEPSLEELQQRVLDQLHAGEPLDRESLVAAHPEHASALQAFFSVVDVVEGQTEDGPPLARLGEFRILGPLGRGGMGVVYDAEQTSLKRRVALKVLPPLLRMDPRVLSRFRREAEAAGRLRHPNIVPVYSVGEAAGTPFFAMERVEGKSLQQILEARAAGEPTVAPADDEGWRRWSIETIACIADALTYAHGEGILHRDVKPGNILIETDGTPRLTDFGLALDLHSPGLTQSGEVLGSPQYMSPEQALRRDAPVDERTDVYSLAVTLFEMLTRKLPYAGTTSAELFTALVSGRVIAPRRIDSSISPALEKVLLCALRRDPRERYRNTGEFAKDLRAALEGRPPSPRALAPARRRARGKAALVVAALVLAGLGIWWAQRDGDHAPDVAKPATLVADVQAPTVPPDQAAAQRRWRDAGLRVEDGHPVVTAAFYKHYVGRRLAVLKDVRPLAFWLDLEEIHIEDGPIRLKDLLGKVFADPAERDEILAKREQGMAVARRFCLDWNENWSGEAQKAIYDGMVAELQDAGLPAVPYLFHVLSTDPATAFGGRQDAGEVSARMQVRALFALMHLDVHEGVPLLIVQCKSPSLTVASNAGVLLQKFTGENFSADFLKAPELSEITWWTLRRKAKVVGTRATVRALLRQIQEGIAQGLPGDADADWWDHEGMRIMTSIERVIGRKLPVAKTRDMGQQLAQFRKLKSWWDAHEIEILQ